LNLPLTWQLAMKHAAAGYGRASDRELMHAQLLVSTEGVRC